MGWRSIHELIARIRSRKVSVKSGQTFREKRQPRCFGNIRRKGAQLVAAVTAVAMLYSPAVAKPKRSVVLLDFSGPPSAPTSETESLAAPDVDAIARAMARQFTEATPETTAPDLPTWTSSKPTVSPAALGNPFVTYALSRQPYAPALARLPGNTLKCVAPVYRPSFGFGRLAEERRRAIFPMVHRAACEHGLPVGLLDALIMQESRYQATALSPKGAIGLAQLMPGTARQLGVDAYTLADNLRGGARYLKEQYNRFGRYDLALAAYNAGPGRVQRVWAVPRIAETQGYVRAIMANWTGVLQGPAVIAAPMPFRQAQRIFMPARIQRD